MSATVSNEENRYTVFLPRKAYTIYINKYISICYVHTFECDDLLVDEAPSVKVFHHLMNNLSATHSRVSRLWALRFFPLLHLYYSSILLYFWLSANFFFFYISFSFPTILYFISPLFLLCSARFVFLHHNDRAAAPRGFFFLDGWRRAPKSCFSLLVK